MGGKSSSSTAQTTNQESNNMSTVVDGSDNEILNVSGSGSVSITDRGAVEQAIDLSKHAITENFGALENAFDFVQTQSNRNYEFAETVAVPLNQQTTEDFNKYSMVIAAVVSMGFIYASTKKG